MTYRNLCIHVALSNEFTEDYNLFNTYARLFIVDRDVRSLKRPVVSRKAQN
jgi:transcriptional regulator GlxA family with amidase domain